MKDKREIAQELYNTLQLTDNALQDSQTAHLYVNHNMVVGSHLLPGLTADVEETENGIGMLFRVQAGRRIARPVHLCFGMLPAKGLQEVRLRVEIEEEAHVDVLAHCTFPNAVDIIHRMEADIVIAENAQYSYTERHVHCPSGGIQVVPHARVHIKEGARFRTDFELIKGRVGSIEIDYESTCEARSVLEMNARINGTGSDLIKIRETGHLIGDSARGVLTSRIALRDQARAEVYNKLTASAPFAVGHVDCKEIVQDQGVAIAVPIVEVSHPKAHVTHEAAIGSVDDRQLETLMSRGLSEDEAVELIIKGLLK